MTETPAPRAAASFVATLTAAVAVWAALIATLAYRGAFVAPAARPQLAIVVAILLPPLLFVALMRLSGSFRTRVLAVDPVLVCAVQGWRVVGSGFLVAHGFGYLPAVFAYQAGWGDVLVGLLAPLAAARLARDPAFLVSPAYRSFHMLGVLDLVLAPVTGTIIRRLYQGTEMAIQVAPLAEMPLVFIVTFMVPFFLCLHIAAFAQIRAVRAQGQTR